jgi:hypothetical protein
MPRRTTVSALATLGLLAAVAAGQPPAPPAKKDADPTDALIQKALTNDPDVLVARAKVSLAEAELAKARQATVARVLALRDTIDQQRQAATRLEARVALHLEMVKAGRLPPDQVLAVQDQLAAARAALARAETELRLLTGDGPKAAAESNAERAFLDKLLRGEGALAAEDERTKVLRVYAGLLDQARAAAGPIPDRIRAALDKKVRLGNKGDGIALDAAMQVFKKEAGLDVPIRPTPSPMPRIVLDGEELPVGAWFQLFEDHGGVHGIAFYVREYGILMATRQTAPPGAMTLTEFWRSVPAAAAKPPAGKRHILAHDKLPQSVKAAAGDEVLIWLPVKPGDVEQSKVGSDNPAVTARLEPGDGGVAVVVRSSRPGKAKVSWAVTDMAGRRFAHPGLDVEFE